MESAENIVYHDRRYIKEFGVPDYLSNVVTTKDAIKLINESRRKIVNECIEIVHDQCILGHPEFIEDQLHKLVTIYLLDHDNI